MIKHLKIGDIDYILRFKIGILRHIKELTGQDPIDFVTNQAGDTFLYVSTVVNAGIRCQCDAKGDEYPERSLIDRQISANLEVADVKIIVGYLTEFLQAGEAGSPVQENV